MFDASELPILINCHAGEVKHGRALLQDTPCSGLAVGNDPCPKDGSRYYWCYAASGGAANGCQLSGPFNNCPDNQQCVTGGA